MNHRNYILDAAKGCVGAREEAHGKPEDSFSTIAGYWSVYLDKEVTCMDVAAMMCLLKIARSQSNMLYADNWVDIAGYAACGGGFAVQTEERLKNESEN